MLLLACFVRTAGCCEAQQTWLGAILYNRAIAMKRSE